MVPYFAQTLSFGLSENSWYSCYIEGGLAMVLYCVQTLSFGLSEHS